jgi:sugar phosphate permease
MNQLAPSRGADASRPVVAGSYRRQVVAMLWLVCFFNYADRQAIYAVFPVLEQEFAFDKVQLGLIGSAGLVVAAVLLMLAFLGANFVATIFLTWTPTFLVEKFGYSLRAAGLNGTLFIHLASAARAFLAGIAADRLAGRFAGGRVAVQACGLLFGAAFVATVGLCKGCYDAGIFASLFDQIEPEARASAAGIMNTVGCGGGALGPLFVGLATRYGGGGSDVENMSRGIAAGSIVYLVCAALLIAAMLCSRRPAPATARTSRGPRP